MSEAKKSEQTYFAACSCLFFVQMIQGFSIGLDNELP